jgi:tetratricopeptide (TPR) repeat protein
MTSGRGLFFPGLVLAFCGSPQLLFADSPATPPTAQQIYNEAQVAFDKADWPAAIKGFAAIARPDDGGEMSRSQGVIHARLSQAYAHERMTGEAEREAALALKGIRPQDQLERAMMWLAIAEAQRYDLAMTSAIDSYGKGLDAAQEAKNAELVVSAEVGLAMCYMTVSPEKATPLLDAILAAPAAATYPKLQHAQYYDLRGRASLNLGQTREAMPFLTKAIDLSGGLRGSQVNLIQVGIRGDAAIGALLMKHDDEAREYLSWTGAGHLPSDEWTRGLGSPPVCDEAMDIRPDDLVVVEFSIAEDGHVVGAAPIYASRPGMLGTAFAKAVKQWRWNPERITKLTWFWRNMIRVELRCISRPNPRGLADPFYRETYEWLFGSQLTPEDLAPLKKGYVTANDPRLERDDLAAIPALLERLRIETDDRKAQLIASHLVTALDKAKAPAAARALAMYLESFWRSSSRASERVRSMADHLAILEHTDPQSAATAWFALEYAIDLEMDGRFKDARPILERILAYPPDVLGEHDPVREVATLHLAALQRRAGDAAGADANIKTAGLTRAQCMLFDVRPVVTDNAVYYRDFPDEALRWGFDGYVRESFDINADGRVENVRTIIAYPPFVFRAGAEHTVAHFRYLAPVVDGVSAGCDGHSVNFIYKPNQ